MNGQKEKFVGVDWATEAHQICVVDADGVVEGERSVPATGAGLAELGEWLLRFVNGNAALLHVSIEVPHGPVVETLLEREMNVYAINPKQLDRFRDRFTVAGAKDDRRDARVLADSLRTDRSCFRKLRIDEPLVIELREWSRMTEDLQQERVRLGNRVREQLRRYYPQMLKVHGDVAADWFLDLWDLVPTPAAATQMREPAVRTLLELHRIRKTDGKTTLAMLRQKPVRVAPGTTEAAVAHIRAVSARLRLINEQLAEAHKRLDELTAALGRDALGQKREQRDVDILRSSPGVGRIVLATLLAEASQPLAERNYHALRSLSGVAPVTQNSGKRSGKRSKVIMRHACNMRLRDALYHWARVASQHDPVSRVKYAEFRKRGKTHGRALRGVADGLLKVACVMLRDGAVFDPERRRQAALQRAA